MKYEIFYDDTCPICKRSVAYVKRIDRKKLFTYLPLPKPGPTLILKAKGKTYKRGKAVFRIFWLIGGFYKPLGLLYYLPGIDFFYSLFAKHRNKFR